MNSETKLVQIFQKQAPAAGYLPHVYLMEPFFIFLEVTNVSLFDIL